MVVDVVLFRMRSSEVMWRMIEGTARTEQSSGFETSDKRETPKMRPRCACVAVSSGVKTRDAVVAHFLNLELALADLGEVGNVADDGNGDESSDGVLVLLVVSKTLVSSAKKGVAPSCTDMRRTSREWLYRRGEMMALMDGAELNCWRGDTWLVACVAAAAAAAAALGLESVLRRWLRTKPEMPPPPPGDELRSAIESLEKL